MYSTLPITSPVAVSPALSHRLGEAEVGEERRGAVVRQAALDDHVGRLDVAMNQAGGVHCVESVGDLGDHLGGVLRCERPVGRDQAAEVAAGHVAHRHIEQTVSLPGSEDGDHSRVLDRGGRQRLGAKASSEALLSGQLGPDHLERDEPVEPQLPGQVDDPHAAMPDRALDAEAAELGACSEPRSPSCRSLD